jgi:hypothetical protein
MVDFVDVVDLVDEEGKQRNFLLALGASTLSTPV